MEIHDFTYKIIDMDGIFDLEIKKKTKLYDVKTNQSLDNIRDYLKSNSIERSKIQFKRVSIKDREYIEQIFELKNDK